MISGWKALLLVSAACGCFLVGRGQAQSGAEPCVASAATYTEGDFEVRIARFHPANPSGGLVLLMGPTGGTTRLETSYAKALCEAGLAAVMVNQWTDDQEYNLDLEIHDRIYRRAQRAIDLVLRQFPEKHVGILGTSLGATHAAIASLRIERVNSIFLIVGGAPIASILATSAQPVLAEGKEKRFKLYGFRSDDEYEKALRKAISLEPLKMRPVRGLPRMGMVIANRDDVVPTRFQRFLRDSWKPERVIESEFGHLGAILEAWFCHKAEMVSFFQRALVSSSR